MYNFDSVLIKKQNPREDLAVFSNRRISEAFNFPLYSKYFCTRPKRLLKVK